VARNKTTASELNADAQVIVDVATISLLFRGYAVRLPHNTVSGASITLTPSVDIAHVSALIPQVPMVVDLTVPTTAASVAAMDGADAAFDEFAAPEAPKPRAARKPRKAKTEPTAAEDEPAPGTDAPTDQEEAVAAEADAPTPDAFLAEV
jgi:hypothetical protein